LSSSGLVEQPERLLERDSDLKQLASDISDAREGGGRLVLLSGPAGIGKTAMVRSVERHAEGDGLSVLRARGAELEQGFAFGVVRQLFERLLLDCEPDELARLLRFPARAAGALVGVPDSEDLVSEYRSFAFLHGLYSLVVNLTERGPILITVDDAHWADEPSLRWLSYLAGRLDGLRALVVAAIRDGGLSAGHRSLAAMASESGTRVLTVEPLSPAASSVLVERQFGEDAAPEFRAACHAATGGNPFFLGELLRALRGARIAPTREGAAKVAEHRDRGPRPGSLPGSRTTRRQSRITRADRPRRASPGQRAAPRGRRPRVAALLYGREHAADHRLA